MNIESPDPRWTRLSKALFGARRTSDESLFTYQVMEEIRRIQPASWHLFLRWAVPALGVAVASLFLAAQPPTFSMDEGLTTVTATDYP